MDVAHLRAFVAVAEELHFGRAAERLHMAQPPLSRTIKQLERELGVTLLDRTTRSVQLTPSGAALVEGANEVFDALRRARSMVDAASGGEIGTVRIAFAGLSTHALVARIARAVRSRRPGIRLELSSQNFALPLMKKLLDAETDIAFGRWDVIPPKVASRIVMADSLVLAVPASHALAHLPSISGAHLPGLQFISLPPWEGSVLTNRLQRLAQDNGFVPDIAQIVPDTQTALALVSAEVACHLTLSSVAHNVDDRHIVFLKLDDDSPDVDLRAAWRKTDPNPALEKVLREVIQVTDMPDF